jgi:hypothetical protein
VSELDDACTSSVYACIPTTMYTVITLSRRRVELYDVTSLSQSCGQCDDRGATMVAVLAVVARTVPEVGMHSPVATAGVTTDQVSGQVDVREGACCVEK